MNKSLRLLMIVSFFSIAIRVWPADKPLMNPVLSDSNAFFLSEPDAAFSLKMEYQKERIDLHVPIFNPPNGELSFNLQETGQNPRIDELKLVIKKTKKKRVGSMIATAAFAALGGFFVYQYAVYEPEELARDPSQTEYRPQRISKGRVYIFGACISLGIGATFLFSNLKARKRIKSYEEELKKLSEEQSKL